ncbi:hypothetical protein TWF281_002778 [Arthrobotrys megalospora]
MDQSLQTPEPSPPSLGTMPPEIRNQIYGYLLDSKACDKPKDVNGKPKPNFYPSILSVNRKTYKEAHGILYGTSGPIVTVALYMSNAAAVLKQGLVQFHTTRYTRSIAGRQLHIIVRPTFVPITKREPFAFVLVGMENIKNFCRFLKFINWAENDGRGISYEFNFEPYKDALGAVPGPPEASSGVQKELVDVFSVLRASCQKGKSKGLVDKKLEVCFFEKLNDRVIWLHAETLELYTKSLALYNEANDMLVEGNFDTALRYYDCIVATYTKSIDVNPLLQSPEAALEGSLSSRLVTIMTSVQSNRALMYMLATFSDKHKGAMKKKVTAKMFRQSLEGAEVMMAGIGGAMALMIVPRNINAAIWQVIAILRAINGDTGRHISMAYGYAARLVSDDDEEGRLRLERLRDRTLESGGDNPELATRVKLIRSLVNALPCPLIPAQKYSPIKSTSVLNERFLLHELRYTGPYYRHDIQVVVADRKMPGEEEPTVVGERVDQEYCREVLEDLAVQRKKCRGVYDYSIWVGPESFHFKGSDKRMRDKGIPAKDVHMGYPFDVLRLPF